MQSYTVPKPLVEQFEKLERRLRGSAYTTQYIPLDEVREDIGHTIVHYLYTGEYQTLAVEEEGAIREREYERSVRVYCAALEYDMHDLTSKAMRYIEHFHDSVDIFRILPVAAGAWDSLPKDNTWYPDYLDRRLAAAFESDHDIFKKADFMKCVGKSLGFDRHLVSTMTKLYSDKISTYNKGEWEEEESESDDDDDDNEGPVKGPPAKRRCFEKQVSSPAGSTTEEILPWVVIS